MALQRSEADNDTSRPGVAKWPHILGGSAVILQFYAFASLTLVLLSGWVALEAVAGYLGGSLRWAVVTRGSFRRHFEVLQALLRSLRLRKQAETQVPLAVADAPELFAMLESLCFLLNIAPAPAVFLEMDGKASFQHGERITLGIGFDLFAGLTRSELEVVLAHELCHASLPRWIMGRWLAHGLQRGLQLSRALSRLCPPRERSNPTSLASALLQVTEGLVEATARHAAAFSRQEELAADRGAAVILGSEAVHHALLKMESLKHYAARLSWHERLAQLEAQTFSAWLTQEFSKAKPVTITELNALTQDRYSTHPSLRDRLAALPPTTIALTQPDTRSAISLLANPDALAESLFARVLATTIKEEERDTRKLRRWIKETRVARDLRPVQACGGALVLAAAIAATVAWSVGAGPGVLSAIWASLAVGLLLFHLGRYREQFTLPLPDFGLLKHTWDTDRDAPDDELKRVKTLCAEQVSGKNPKKACRILESKCFDALRECDYPKAAVAAQMLLAQQPDSLAGLLTSAITLAWRGDGKAADVIAAVQRKNGLKGPSLCWGIAWAFMFRGNWGRAEALLEQTIDQHPADPTLLNLRALCQARRGKIQSAIHNARRACEPQPKNIEHAKFLIGLLLEGGYVREAQTRLAPLEQQIDADPELMLLVVRTNLSLRNYAGAEAWSRALTRKSAPAYMIVQLAAFHELAGLFDQAGSYYSAALSQGHFPDACLGLSRVEAGRNNISAARQHALNALAFLKPLGKFATPPITLLRPILTQLATLEPPVWAAHAWLANLPDNALPSALAGMSFIVYGTSQSKAEQILRTVMDAMFAGGIRPATINIAWRLAPPDHQPFGNVCPGVQPLLNDTGSSPYREFHRRGLWQSRDTRIQSLLQGLHFIPGPLLPLLPADDDLVAQSV